MVENQQNFVHQVDPNSDGYVLSTTQSNWYALSTMSRPDYVKKIKGQDLEFSRMRIGLGLDSDSLHVISSYEDKVRQLPYDNNFKASVTFEIDSTIYNLQRHEFTLIDWLTIVGGVASTITAVIQLFGLLDDPQMFVTSALIADQRLKSKKDEELKENND